MIPKIEFRYSWIYDNNRRQVFLGDGKEYPSEEKIKKYTGKVEKYWEKYENKILLAISKISGLKWKRKEIICYTVGRGVCISDPLTMKIFENKNDFVDTLIHELIHQILTQNSLKNYQKYLDKKYNEESRKTKNHILLIAIYSELYLNFFNRRRLWKNILKDNDKPDYARAWKIVQKESFGSIIKTFRGRMK